MTFPLLRWSPIPAAAGLLAALAGAQPAAAQPLALMSPNPYSSSSSIFQAPPQNDPRYGAAPDEDDRLPARLRRQIVDYPSREAPGTIIVDTPNTYLYLILGGGKALRYGIGVGREGFTWAGVESIARMAVWPDWIPPSEMIARQPYLPRFMAGGPGNPLGARALYLGNTAYRIHGTNDPSTIGHRVSSGCIRMTNEDAIDLFGRVKLGNKVIVLPAGPRRAPGTLQASVRPRSNARATTDGAGTGSSGAPFGEQ
jgi:lipoprotein-anchoring transpeptidase ErfK/SrfK